MLVTARHALHRTYQIGNAFTPWAIVFNPKRNQSRFARLQLQTGLDEGGVAASTRYGPLVSD